MSVKIGLWTFLKL